MSRLDNLVNAILEEAERVNKAEEDPRVHLTVLLVRAIERTMLEIKRGADSEDFQDLAVINLIIMGAQENYTTAEMGAFVRELKNEDPDDSIHHQHHH